MEDKEAVQMMRRASCEIKDLRRQIATLHPKAEAYDILAASIRAMAPRQSYGHTEDIAATLDRRADEISARSIKADEDASRQADPSHGGGE